MGTGDPSPAKGVFVSGQITSLAQTFQDCNVPLKTLLVVLGVGWCLPLLGSPGTACIRGRRGECWVARRDAPSLTCAGVCTLRCQWGQARIMNE